MRLAHRPVREAPGPAQGRQAGRRRGGTGTRRSRTSPGASARPPKSLRDGKQRAVQSAAAGTIPMSVGRRCHNPEPATPEVPGDSTDREDEARRGSCERLGRLLRRLNPESLRKLATELLEEDDPASEVDAGKLANHLTTRPQPTTDTLAGLAEIHVRAASHAPVGRRPTFWPRLSKK